MTGTVKWFNEEKKYGFITPDGAMNQDEEVFVHLGEVRRSRLQTLTKGQLVSFETFPGKKSLSAKNIKVMRESIAILK